LGVDAKRAQVILDQSQAETNSEVFSEEGDAFENLEIYCHSGKGWL
jgi:hypothetical protein